MRVLLVHNDYSVLGGEEFLVASVADILESHGHDVLQYRRRSPELQPGVRGSAKAFFVGIHNPWSCRQITELLDSFRPNAIHVQNLYPLISPSILPVMHRSRIPIVMNVQNYRLGCPNGLHFSHGEICTRCLGGREQWCVLRNCEGSLLKCTGYALRNAVARWTGAYTRNVGVFTPPTSFHARWLSELGIEPERIHVIPNMVDDVAGKVGESAGDYVGFAGRVSPEKGVDVLMQAARRMPDVPFRIAGSYDRLPTLPSTAPPNVRFLGHLGPEDLSSFYAGARMIVVPSVWFEGFPTVIPQAMLRGRPVIASDVGGLRDVIDDGATGYLFPTGDAEQLAARIGALWSDPRLASIMGRTAREKALREYSRDRYYNRLMAAFEAAGARRRGASAHDS